MEQCHQGGTVPLLMYRMKYILYFSSNGNLNTLYACICWYIYLITCNIRLFHWLAKPEPSWSEES